MRARSARKLVFRDRKDDTDRFDLCDHEQRRSAACLHIISGIHQAQPDYSADRRGDVAIRNIQLGRIDQALVRLHLTFVLIDGRLLGGIRLFRNRIGFHQSGVAGEIYFCIRQQRLVAFKLPLVLFEERLIGSADQFQKRLRLPERSSPSL